MVIKCVEIKSFRSLQDAKLDCDKLTAILGRNGAGKSSFLHALSVFYDVAAPVTEEDFFCRDKTCSIEIRVTYSDLQDEEKDEFRTYINNDMLIVTKRIQWDNGIIRQRYYAAALQIPQFAALRVIQAKSQRRVAWNELVDRGELPDLGGRARSADEVEQRMTAYETAHSDIMTLIEREEQFFGPRNIGGGKLDKFTKYVLIPAVREASEEVGGRKGAIYQILDMIVLRRVNARQDVKQFKTEFEEQIKRIYSSENLTELPELGNSLSETLEKFAPGSRLNLKWEEFQPPELKIPPAKATLVEDNFEGEINRKGHGLQRALVLTLLQHLALTTPLEITESNGVQSEDATEENREITTEPTRGPDLILAIEEPELYLHPIRCRYMAELLNRLVDTPDIGLGARNQVIYTTHSPYFIDLHKFDRIRLVQKISTVDNVIPSSNLRSFTLNEAMTEHGRICSGTSAVFTLESYRARAIPVMNSIVNEGFFADKVLVVEGTSDVGILWKLQQLLNKKWDELGIAIIPAGGKHNIDKPVIIFRGFKIPTYFVFDGDANSSEANRTQAIQCNRRYLQLAGSTNIEDFPATQIHDTWAVFRETSESIIKDDLGDSNFDTIRSEVASTLGYSEPSRVLKNIEGATCFVENVYNKNMTLPNLEQIVEKVTQM